MLYHNIKESIWNQFTFWLFIN